MHAAARAGPGLRRTDAEAQRGWHWFDCRPGDLVHLQLERVEVDGQAVLVAQAGIAQVHGAAVEREGREIHRPGLARRCGGRSRRCRACAQQHRVPPLALLAAHQLQHGLIQAQRAQVHLLRAEIEQGFVECQRAQARQGFVRRRADREILDAPILQGQLHTRRCIGRHGLCQLQLELALRHALQAQGRRCRHVGRKPRQRQALPAQGELQLLGAQTALAAEIGALQLEGVLQRRRALERPLQRADIEVQRFHLQLGLGTRRRIAPMQ